MSQVRSTILIIDDDDDVRLSIAEALESRGYAATAALNGATALRQMCDEGLRPDLILLDLIMPDMDGWEFRRRQQRVPALAHIPVVLLTAYDLPHVEAARADAAGLLRKPVQLAELVRMVESILQGGNDARA